MSPCEGGRSREHYLSRALFVDEHFTVSGAPHAEPIDLHIDDLVARCLCKRHNEELSALDTGAADVLNGLRHLNDLRQARANLSLRDVGYSSVRLRPDGLLFERWALKTAMNCAVVFRKALEGWSPPDWVADVIFGHRNLPAGSGLGGFNGVGDEISNQERFQVAFGRNANEAAPSAVVITVRGGLRFFCSWERPLSDFTALAIGGVVYTASEALMLHPKKYDFTKNLSLEFDWTGRRTTPDRQLARLRARYKSPARK